MRKILFAGAAVLALAYSSQAFAQEWNGAEIGIQGGYAWGTSSGLFVDHDPPRLVFSAPYRFSVEGPLGGAHAGYLLQFDHVVVGVEGDIEAADVSGHGTPTPGFSIHSRMDFDGSLRAKAGWSFGRFLPYATGGVAIGDVKTDYTSIALGPLGSTSGVRVGWTGGGGLQFAIDPNWQVGGEYRYTDLGKKGFHDVFNADHVFDDNNKFTYSAVRVNLTYRFASPPPPMPAPPPVPAAAPAPPPPQPPRTFLVFFDFDKYTLTADAKKVVAAAADTFKANGVARIELTGYTDLAGTQAYNLRLSKRRAEAVAAALEKMGVAKSAINVMWRGKENPRVPTPDGVREPQNRRVEIVMP